MTAGIVACVPVAERASSQVVHLYLSGYTPAGGGKAQNRDRRVVGDDFLWQHSMCNTVAVNEVHPGVGTLHPPHSWKYAHHTLSEARQMIASGGYLRWCRFCIAHAAEHENLLGTMVGLIIDRQVRLADE